MSIRCLSGSFLGLVLGLAVSPAEAHSVLSETGGWAAGFNHPLHGWDHFLVMVAVGLWAAQQGGRARWAVPLAFLSAMAVGGLVGVSGLVVPVIEPVILVSVILFSGLVLARARLPLNFAVSVVALFAFFHGFAHGQEMPDAASPVTFGLGFLIATALLHGMGYAAASVAMACAAMTAGTALAQAPVRATQTAAERMPEIIVYGRQDSLLGVADSASQGTVGAEQLARRPVSRAGEVLETVPGVIITQHAGGGKANQYFMRGFNLDHGTDFATSLDDMPINLRSHGHGQGYSDMNIVIPELVERVNYRKGVYYAENGDFSSAGAAHLETFKTLPRSLAVAEGGMYGYGRGVAASSFAAGPGNLLLAAEVSHSDGPWARGDNFWKKNGLATYSQGDAAEGFSVTARGYHGRWNSSDQIAESAVASGLVGYFASLDDTTGGHSQRYSVQGEWHRSSTRSSTRIAAYGFFYDLDLLSNFTYFLTDPVRGDQFQQKDTRLTSGLHARHIMYGGLFGAAAETTVGVQLRNDNIRNGLYNTTRGMRTAKADADGNVFPAVVRRDSIAESSYGLYVQNATRLTDWLRTEIGVRGDIFRFSVRNALAQNSGARTAHVVSPKLSVIFGPWDKTELYLQAGRGFHSNDARGVLSHVDPATGLTVDADGNPITPADPLVRTQGAEVGLRTLAVPNLQSTLSVWMLDVKSELVFVGDAGTTEPSRPSRRYGVEFANYYTPVPWLTLDADLSFSRARYRDSAPEGDRIPGSIATVISAGATAQQPGGGLFGSLRLRYFGPRALVEDNSFRSAKTVLVNARIGYEFSERWSIAADVFNLLDRRDHDIDYAYESRIAPAATSQTEIHFHPVEPRQVRITLKARL